MTTKNDVVFIPLLISSLLISPELLAQEDQETTELEEVTVTATRVEKNQDKIPASVGVVKQDDIQFATQQTGLDESLVKIPGIFMQNRYNFAQDLRVSIRGFGARSSFGIRGIKVIVDGIPESSPDGQANVDSIDLGSAERIEVIRGPVSSLYGNASGGAILIQSETAPETPFISVRPSFGESGFQKHQLKLGGTKDKLDYMANISDLDYDGYRDHNQTKSTLLNSKFGYSINESSKLTTTLNVADSPLANDPGGLTAEEVTENRSQARDKNVRLNTGESLKQTRLGFVYKNELNDTDIFTFNNYYIWRDIDIRIPAGRLGAGVDLERFSLGGGAQYTSQKSLSGYKNRLTLGIDIAKQNDERQRFNLDGFGTGDQIQDQDEDVTSLGIFVQDELSLTEKTELTLGGRYDSIDFDVKDKFLTDGNDSGDRTFDKFSPSLGLRHSLTNNLNLFGNISKSFETPTARELGNPNGGGFNQDLKPQTATNFEVGLKGKINKHNRYELSLFNIDVDDELIPFETTGGETFFQNAGESKRKGVELLLETQPIDGLTASLAYTYSDFTFNKFIDDDGNDFSGKNIPGVPESLVHFDVNYWHSSGLYSQFDVLHADKVYTNNDNSVNAKAYTVSNLRFGYSKALGDWEVSPFVGVNNLFDEEYNSNIRINAFGNRFFEPAPERNVYGGVEVQYDFGE